MENKIRVGAVSYLNTKPLLYGIERSEIIHQIDLSLNYPSEVARQLISDEIDMGLVPVAIIPLLKDYFIDADYCIGANGKVGSVAIYSDVPMEEIETLYLDYQSRTSVALAQILLKYYWKKGVNIIQAFEGYQKKITGTTAGVVIGDRAFLQKKISRFEFDLAEAWKIMTGFPFVFAAWVANKELPETFIDSFNRANEFGLLHINTVVAELAYPSYDLKYYYTHNISYRFDEQKRMGLKLFLDFLSQG